MDDPARPPFDCVVRAWVAHERELLAFLQRRSSDPDAAEDLLQEVFLKFGGQPHNAFNPAELLLAAISASSRALSG
jgi:DNA-directed RNA polymerase specialized sigma24 family protein